MSHKYSIAIFTSEHKRVKGGLSQHIQTLEYFLKKKCNVAVFVPSKIYFLNSSSVMRQILASLGWQLVSIFRRWHFDILNIHAGPGGVIFFPFFVSGKIYCTCHHTYYQQIHFMKEWYKYLFFPFENFLYHFSDKVITVSQSTKNALVQHYNVPPEKIFILENFSDVTPLGQKNFNRRKLSLLFVGRLDARKNPIFCIHLLRELLNRGYNFTLDIVGGGKLFEPCKEEILHLGLSANVFLHGIVSDKQKIELMKNSEYLIVPSVFEGQGIVCLEGILSNICVLCNDTDGLRDVCAPSNLFTSLETLVTKIISLSSDDYRYNEAVSCNSSYILSRGHFKKKLFTTYGL